MSIPEQLHIGSRIQVGKDRATVRFIGTVANTKGEWLGVEWDDPCRGKHDGTHQGILYFMCSHPTSGSFIRFHPEKVQLGVSFLKALHGKYLEEDDLTKVREDQAYDKSKDIGELYFGGNKQIVVETYGFEKIQRSQRQLSSLKVVGLAELMISCAGKGSNEITDAKLTIEDLDLSRNLISKWETVSDIVSQLPHLSILRLNQLRFSSPPTQGLELSNLKTLSLNKVLITWKDIELLAPCIPLLEDLQLGGNQLSQLGPNLDLKHLKWLNLEDNLITDWAQVAKLGFLPNLDTLYLNDNQLTKIDKPSTNEMFAKLSYLRIERNAIGDWDSLNALNCLANLTKLRCKENPIFKDLDKELEAAQIVGRIKSLTNANGNTLTSRERTDLERYYLKSCTRDGTTHEAISAIHPRYAQLCTKHGEPDLQVQIKETSTALKDRLINITLTIRDDAPLTQEKLLSMAFKKELPETTTSISKKFLRTMTIRNVKHMIQRLLKIPAARQHLFLLQSISTQERDLLVMDITDDLRDLKFYAINDGDEILVMQT